MKSQSNSQELDKLESLINEMGQLLAPERFNKVLELIFDEYSAIDTMEQNILGRFS